MEKILCSAIWYKELPMPFHGPRNIEYGLVLCGFRHVHCIHQIFAITGKKHHEVGESIQGFLTNLNRFVDREEGGEIALESKQIEELNYSKNKLFSEDLY